MKLFTALAALTLIAAPAQAFGTIPCNGAISGFIQVGNQTACFRKLTAQELEASRQAARDRKAQRDAEIAAAKYVQAVNFWTNKRDEAEQALDQAGDQILQPGGRANYRRALRHSTAVNVHLNQLKR